MAIFFNNPVEISVEENITDFALNLQARLDTGDVDVGITYSITGGIDADDFTIDTSTGELSFKSTPDYEAPVDDGNDNIYNITITAKDTGSNDSQEHTLTITVTDDPFDSIEPVTDYKPSYELSSIDGKNGFSLLGGYESDYSGWSVSGAGDINHDGFDDIIVGAYNVDYLTFPQPGHKQHVGESYVVFGNSGGFDANIELSGLNGDDGFIIMGLKAYERSGLSVSNAGDINGDGNDDFIIGAFSFPESPEGKGYVVFGAPDLSSIDLNNLDGNNGFTFTGGPRDDEGISVSSAGDINGDAFDDMIVGFANGAAHVVFGGPNDTFDATGINLDEWSNGNTGFRLTGISRWKNTSADDVSAAGDVNGDGYGDIIIGSPYAKNGDAYAGAGYVVFGASGGFTDDGINVNELNGNNGFAIHGIQNLDKTGFSVSGAGDINGDGYGDIIIGAPKAGENGFADHGAAYVVFGAGSSFTSSGINLSGLDGANGFAILGSNDGDESGYSVSGVGDINRDGYDDLIIGAREAGTKVDDSGISYVLFGASNGFTPNINLKDLDGSNGFALKGAKDGDRSGKSVSGVGDVNNDGYADLIIGAPTADPNGKTSGETYIIFGGPISLAETKTTINQSDDHSTKPTASLSEGQTTPTPFDDILEYGRDEDVLSALPGNDYVDGGLGNDTMGGNTGNDTIEGGLGADLLFGWLGDDLIYAGFQNDLFLDHSSNVVWAGPGYDTVVGGAGADTLGGGNDDDSVIGGRGDDLLFGGFGKDTVLGDQGLDTIYGGWGNDMVKGGAHSDLLFGGDGRDILQGGSGNDTLWGDAGADTLYGGIGDDYIDGGGDADLIFNSEGNDTVNGGNGDDILWGGPGDDQLTGGLGADTFGFTLTNGNDRVTDFNLDDDILDVSETGFTGLASITSAAEDTDDGLLITLSGSTSVLFTGLTLSDLTAMDITYIS